jgi:hypothetical protein
MCSLRFENNLLTIEGVRFASISKKTPLSKLSFAFISLALPLLAGGSGARPFAKGCAPLQKGAPLCKKGAPLWGRARPCCLLGRQGAQAPWRFGDFLLFFDAAKS